MYSLLSHCQTPLTTLDPKTRDKIKVHLSDLTLQYSQKTYNGWEIPYSR